MKQQQNETATLWLQPFLISIMIYICNEAVNTSLYLPHHLISNDKSAHATPGKVMRQTTKKLFNIICMYLYVSLHVQRCGEIWVNTCFCILILCPFYTFSSAIRISSIHETILCAKLSSTLE